MIDSGFSWPSTTLVCSAEYTSLKLMPVGAEPKALNIDVHSGLTGTRILKPFRSSAVLIGLVLVVMLRKPLSRQRSKQCRLTFAMTGDAVIDGRNLLNPTEVRAAGLSYDGIGRS